MDGNNDGALREPVVSLMLGWLVRINWKYLYPLPTEIIRNNIDFLFGRYLQRRLTIFHILLDLHDSQLAGVSKMVNRRSLDWEHGMIKRNRLIIYWQS